MAERDPPGHVERVQVTLQPRAHGQLRCAWCHGTGGLLLACAQCGCRVHPGCAAADRSGSTLGCPTLGCGAQPPTAGDPSGPTALPRSGLDLLCLVTVALGACGLAALGAWLTAWLGLVLLSGGAHVTLAALLAGTAVVCCLRRPGA